MSADAPRTTWTRTPSPRIAAGIAPDGPGVYVVGRIDRAHGLPVAQDWRRVAAVRSLREEFLQLEYERPRTATEDDTELWFAPQPTLREAIALEQSLGHRLGATGHDRPDPSMIAVRRVKSNEPITKQGAL